MKDTIERASTRPNGPGNIVWLASFPKSGNTWMRAIITALATHPHLFGVNKLSSGAQPHYVGTARGTLGLFPQWLDRGEIDVLRETLVVSQSQAREGTIPALRKTHEIYRRGDTADPFPLAATRAALLIVRDPRDVASSYSAFFGKNIPEAIDSMGALGTAMALASPVREQTAQPWGSWSSHTLSWLDESVPFPVHLVRYEDLQRDAVATLLPVFTAIGLDCTEEELSDAVERTRFDRLQDSESERGFRETSPKAERFFRKGRAGGWHDELTEQDILAVEADHAEVMRLLGYELSTGESARTSTREVRDSIRRQKRSEWLQLPEHMGIRTSRAQLPETLPDAQHPRPWISVTDQEVLVSFKGGARILVRNGDEAVVDIPEEQLGEDADPSWLLQGWGVTLAMLQRGDLSLHAATVEIGDKVIALAGHRGAGKSTTSMGLRSRGHTLLTDDVTLIEFRDGQAWTTPYSRNVHLLPDAAAAMGLDFDSMSKLAGGRAKVGFRPEDPPVVPRRIDHIIVLQPRLDAESVRFEELRGTGRLSALLAHARRDGIAPLVIGQQRYFDLLAKLANSAPVQAVRRPREGWTLDEVLDGIEAVCGAGAGNG